MTINPGYKQTEVGVIPEEWGIETLGTTGKWLSGGTPSMSQASYWGGAIPWVSPKDMKVARIHDSIDHVTRKALGNGTRLAPKHALLMVVRGMILAHSFPVARAETAIAFNQDIKALVTRESVDSEFLLWWLQASEALLLSITAESTHGTKRVPTDSLFALIVSLPPLPEQRAIASALSDVDALIASLEKLIAKKRDLKQAAMQQLLTGQTRLPGFEGEWEVRRLGEIVEFLDGRRRPVKDSDRAKMRGDVPYYGASGIVDYVNDHIFDEELILLGEDGENILSRNCRLAFKVSGKTWINNHAHVLRPLQGIDINYLTEYLESLNYEQCNTGTAQPKLNKQTCSAIMVCIGEFLNVARGLSGDAQFPREATKTRGTSPRATLTERYCS